VTAPFRLEPLHGQHDRSTFASGEEALDRYFRTQVTQDIRRRIANCFVAVDVATGQVVAYYTIASASIPTPDLPPRRRSACPVIRRCQPSASVGWRWIIAFVDAG
jgi:hypothetical protein